MAELTVEQVESIRILARRGGRVDDAEIIALCDLVEALRAREGVVVPRDFPNIQAVLDGTTSGHYSEWPALRIELKMLISSRGEVAKVVTYALSLMEIDGNYDKALQYLRAVDERLAAAPKDVT